MVPFSLALPSSGALYMSIPNSSIRCANIVLPDDADYFGRGTVDYVIEMTPDPQETWSDLSYQRVTTDENNTAVIPVCFSSIGKRLGNCSKPFTIRITAPAIGLDKTWEGGVCASSVPDTDTGTVPGGVDTPMEGLDDVDLFSVGLLERKKYNTKGAETAFTLQVESYAESTLDISATSDSLSITPSSTQVTTGPDDSYHEIEFTTAPMNTEGTYGFTITATARDCGSSAMCSKGVNGYLVISDQVPDLEGFLVSVFPENINVKNLNPVKYRITIT
ncbi:MAG: hypothetical protein DRO99_02835, partial [Candidatus Aenigmatarchaeota archaeon]